MLLPRQYTLEYLEDHKSRGNNDRNETNIFWAKPGGSASGKL